MEAPLKNHKGKAYIKFANINNIPVTFSVPIVNLEDFEEAEYKSIESSNNVEEVNNGDLSSEILNNF